MGADSSAGFPSPKMSRSIEILLIEDNPADAELVRVFLEKAYAYRFHMRWKRSLREAIRTLEQVSVDAVLLDLSLPDAQGLEAIEKIRSQFHSPVLIVLSGLEDEETALQAIQCGAEDYLFKNGLGSGSLIRAIGHAIQRQQLLQASEQIAWDTWHKHRIESVQQLASGLMHEINTSAQYVTDNISFLESAFSELVMVITEFERLANDDQFGESAQKLVERLGARIKATDIAFYDEEVPAAINDAKRGLGHVASFVQAVRDFARTDISTRQKVCLNDIVDNCLIISRKDWMQNADLKLNLDPSIPPIECSSFELSQAIVGMIENAVQAHANSVRKASGQRDKLFISTSYDGQHALLCLSDREDPFSENPPADLSKSLSTMVDEQDEIGRRLAFAHRIIVGKLGGSLEFDLNADQGATVLAHLPTVCPIADPAAPS
jgi:DNA-binding NarL/FixJ family response regulator